MQEMGPGPLYTRFFIKRVERVSPMLTQHTRVVTPTVSAYPPEFRDPRPIEDQIRSLSLILRLVPYQALRYAKRLPSLDSFVPKTALSWAGWFAVPSTFALAKWFPKAADPAMRYAMGVILMNKTIAHVRRFFDYVGGSVAVNHFRLREDTADALAKLEKQQAGDILLIAAQLGMYHKGRSVRQSRLNFAGNEFGLGSLGVGSIILNHPECMTRPGDLDMDCAGDECDRNEEGQFLHAPFFDFRESHVQFSSEDLDRALEDYGSVTFFFPC